MLNKKDNKRCSLLQAKGHRVRHLLNTQRKNENDPIFVYKKDKYYPYEFFSITPIEEGCSIISYTIQDDNIFVERYQTSKSEEIEIVEECERIDNNYYKLFNEIYYEISKVAISLLKNIELDKNLELLLNDRNFEFSVSRWDAYDSITASESKLRFALSYNSLCIESTSVSGFELGVVPDPPYLIEIHIHNRRKDRTVHYKTTISESMYECFDNTLSSFLRLWFNLSQTIDDICKRKLQIED